MLGKKLFIMLYLIYAANAQYRRIPPRRPVRPGPTELPALNNATEGIASPLPSTNPPRTTTSSTVEAEPTTVTISEPPNMESNEQPSTIDPDIDSLKPNNESESELKPTTPESEPEPEPTESNFDYESESTPEPTADLEPTLQPDPEDEFDPKSTTGPTLIPSTSEKPEDKLNVPNLDPRSPITEAPADSDLGAPTKPEIVSEPSDEWNDVDFECKENNTYLAIPRSCETFVECKKFVAKVKTCPDGLLFNNKALWPQYPCSYPSEVECGDNTITNTFYASSDECPRRFGSFPTINNDCEKYIVCQNGRPSNMKCPMGLGFNPKLGACDWPANVPNCNPKVFNDFVCPKSNKPDRIYNYRYKRSCKLYITCLKGEPRLLRCDSGLSFDDRSSRCISSAAVSNCRSTSEIVDTKLKL